MNPENKSEHDLLSEWFSADMAYERVRMAAYDKASKADLSFLNDTFSKWYVLNPGVDLEDAIKGLVQSGNCPKLGSCSIRVESEKVLPQDPVEREKMLAYCKEYRITLIRDGKSDYDFFNLNENRLYRMESWEVIGSWDVYRLFMEPV